MKFFAEYAKEEIIEYWKKVFPELKEEQEILSHISDVLKIEWREQAFRAKEDSPVYWLQKETEKSAQELKNVLGSTKGSYAMEQLPIWVMPIVRKGMENFANNSLIRTEIKQGEWFVQQKYNQLLSEMTGMAMRTLVFEANYNEKQTTMTEYSLADFYSEYRVLFYLLREETKNYVSYLAEIIQNTAENKKRIEDELFRGEGIGKLVDIHLSCGDKHCDGKSVAILQFEKGRVVYKPRDSYVDSAFQKMLQWINHNMGLAYPLRMQKICMGNNCGWFEYIENRECDDSRLEEFYNKIGYYVCMMYLLNATDMHYENIIADGPDPMFIDLESLFSFGFCRTEEESGERASYKIKELLFQSVSRIGILPHKLKFKSGELEVGGIGIKKSQAAPLKSLMLTEDAEGRMRLEYVNPEMEGKQNSPKQQEDEFELSEYVSSILNGFRSFYKAVLEKRDSFKEAVFHNFGKAQIRVIVKPTMFYANLLKIALHPDFLREPIDRLLLLSRIGLFKEKVNPEVVESELYQLTRNQIPYFYAVFESGQMYDGCTRQAVWTEGKSPEDRFEETFAKLSVGDMETQTTLIEASFYKRNPSENRVCLSGKQYGAVTGEQILKTAREIADYIALRSCVGVTPEGKKERNFWGSNLLLIEEDNWLCSMDSLDFYDGNAGIAHMYLKLWEKTGDGKYKEYFTECMEPIDRLIRCNGASVTRVGLHKGLAGFLRVALEKYKMSGNASDLRLMEEILKYAKEKCKEDEVLDYIGGNGGLLAVLLHTYRELPDGRQKQEVLEIAEIAANRMVSRYETSYSGFAHGFAGIFPYLYQLYTIDGNEVYLNFVKERLKEEREDFWLEQESDWKTAKDNEEYAYGWCHGSPGILLGKLLLYQAGYRDNLIEEEMETAAHNLVKKGLGHSLCYCHGDLGNLEILSMWADCFHKEEWKQFCRNRFRQIYFEVIQSNWREFRYTFNKFNGIMIGLSGIVMALLRNFSDEIITEWL